MTKFGMLPRVVIQASGKPAYGSRPGMPRERMQHGLGAAKILEPYRGEYGTPTDAIYPRKHFAINGLSVFCHHMFWSTYAPFLAP